VCGVDYQYHAGPEAVGKSVAVQKADWYCRPWALDDSTVVDSARLHAVED